MAQTDGSQKKMTRRDFIKIAAVAGGVLMTGDLLYQFWKTQNYTVRDTRLLMGTFVDITLVAKTEQQGRDAIEAAYSEMGRQVHFYDLRNPASELGQLNLSGKADQPSPELLRMIQQANYFSGISNGAFDVTVQPVLAAYRAGRLFSSQELALIDYRNILIQDGQIKYKIPGMQITLDGIAKGKVVDEGANALRSLGYENILVEAGGDLVALGNDPDGNLWKIGVTNPRPSNGNQWLTTLKVQNCAVATSGDYMDSFTDDHSLNHIIDPHTGKSPTELCSATVIAPTLAEADALGTTLMVLGVTKGLALVERRPGIEAMLATKALKIYRSSGFPTA
jgi:thiamine biosynthesis lipoprotein